MVHFRKFFYSLLTLWSLPAVVARYVAGPEKLRSFTAACFIAAIPRPTRSDDSLCHLHILTHGPATIITRIIDETCDGLTLGTGNYSATSNNMKLVHWSLMGGLLHLVQRGGDWAGPQPAQAPPRRTKCNSPPINGQCTNHRIAV